jgi:hypothetical protein
MNSMRSIHIHRLSDCLCEGIMSTPSSFASYPINTSRHNIPVFSAIGAFNPQLPMTVLVFSTVTDSVTTSALTLSALSLAASIALLASTDKLEAFLPALTAELAVWMAPISLRRSVRRGRLGRRLGGDGEGEGGRGGGELGGGEGWC